jgi:Na+-translocating ferredoxin:NAD+ oxidoreductase subunit B
VQVDKTLEPEKSKILAYQDVESIIRAASKYENNIAILPCTCRTMAMMNKSHPECNASVENCMVFGAPARFSVEEGIGRYVGVEECMDILKRAEKEGLIHCTQNTADKHGFICNCCACCCGIFSTAIEHNLMGLFQESDFVPVIDHEKCNVCRKCIKACSFHALMYHMGEKEDKSQDRIIVREDVCIGCGVCASNCPTGAINLKKVRDNQPAGSFIEAVMRMMAGQKKYTFQPAEQSTDHSARA